MTMGGQHDEEEDFKSKFYNLQGIHINERKKNFNKLLKATKFEIPDNQIDIQPRNYQERIFYVDFLIYFKKIDQLVEVLKEGIGVHTSKVLKEQWFFKEAFTNMTEEDIVNKFLPTLSFSLRMKVLKKLSLALSEERMDKIFEFVLERYGLFIAKQFLFSCSQEKIVHVLKNNEITLSTEQLKRLLEKNVDLIKVYFEEYKKNNRRDFDEYDFLNYLVWKHPNLYFELDVKKDCLKVGRFTSRAILKTYLKDASTDVQNVNLNKAAITRYFKDFGSKCLYRFFPIDMKDINSTPIVCTFVSKYPIKKRWEVISQAFKQAYNQEIVEHLNLFEENLAKFFPKEIKQNWAEIKYLESNNLDYIKYFNAKKAFMLLKDKINVTSDNSQRGNLLNEMINVCYQTKDYVTYEEVLKYITSRHRNDNKHVLAMMIYFIEGHIDYNAITEVHWKYINELINIPRIRIENYSFCLKYEYLSFVYKNKLKLNEPVVQYTKDCIKANVPFRLRWKTYHPDVERAVLKCVIEILPTLQLENKEEVVRTILSDVIEFNSAIKNNKALKKDFNKHCLDLNECPPIVELFKEVCTKEQPYSYHDCSIMSKILLYNCMYSEYPLQVINENALLNKIKIMCDIDDKGYVILEAISKVVKKPKLNRFENALLDYLFTKDGDLNYVNYMKSIVAMYYLIEDPKIIVKYFRQILAIQDRDNYCGLNYKVIKKYSHLELDRKVIEHFKGSVLKDSKCRIKSQLLTDLSKVMSTRDFLELVQDYKPESKRWDFSNENEEEKYQIQSELARAFKNLDETSILAPVVMDFCQEDYLQLGLPALYRMLYRVNEETASSYMKILSKRSMSTRKHSACLSFKLLSVKEAMTLYLTICSSETNISAKKYLFNSVLKFFLQNPAESLLNIIFQNMDFIDENDTEMINTLVDSASKIPNKYLPLFIEKVWHFLDALEQKEVKVIKNRNALLNTISQYETDFFLRVNANFLENIIKIYFFSGNDRLQKYSDALDYLVINYLLAYLGEQHFEFVFNIIKSFKDSHWSSRNKKNIDYLFRFFTSAYKKFDKNEVKFLTLFSSFWQNYFNTKESFSEYILLKLMFLFKQNKDIETFSKEVDQFFQELALKYGPHILYGECVPNLLKRFFENIPSSNNTDFNVRNFALYLLKSSSNEFNCFIAFSIINDFSGPDQKCIYLKIRDALRDVNNFTARIYFNKLLRKN